MASTDIKSTVTYIVILIGILIVLVGISQTANHSKIEKFVVGNAVSSLHVENSQNADPEVKEVSAETVAQESQAREIEDKNSQNNADVSSSSSQPKSAAIIQNDKGKIEFSSDVSPGSSEYVIIGNNFASVDSESAPELNKTATITLNVAYDHTPFVLMDGHICSECRVLDYSGGKVTFTVPHFTEFSLAGCNNFTDDASINYPGDYRICAGSYSINDANSDGILAINSSNVVLDCQNAELSGNGSGAGIAISPFPEYGYWYNQTGGFSNLTPITSNISAFLDSITLLSNITIKNCNLKDFEFGMNITAIENSRIEGNSFDNSDMLLAAKDTVFENNQIKNSENGIILIGVNSTVRNNLIQNNSNGIGVGGYGNIVNGNNATGNTNGIVLLFSENAEIYENHASGNSEAGIRILDSARNRIYNNVLESNAAGISMSGLFANSSEGNIINNNIIINNSEGMKFSDSNLRQFFAFVASAITGKNKHVPGHLITGSVISGNFFNNSAKDLAVEGNGFKGNAIINNMFYGAGIDSSLSLNNNILNVEIGGSSDLFQSFTGNLPVILRQGDNNAIITQFDFDFSNDVLDLSKIHLLKQDQGAEKGYVIVSGIENTTKTLYLDNIDPNMNWVCIKDAEITDIAEITLNCQGSDEHIINCNGQLSSGYSCTNTGSQYIITGLKHSGVIQYEAEGGACTLDPDCGSQSTCINKGTAQAYCSYGPMVNGTIYDENGNKVEGINISFYQVSDYDHALNETDTDALIPKTIPDATTDSNGYYSVYLPDNTIWHMVMQGSKKTDFNLFTNKTNNGQGHDSEIFENNTDFNVEGHILHSGAYEHGNKYLCTQFVEFVMFGRNNGDTNVTIRYAVENHTQEGSPTNNRTICDGVEGFINDSDVHYCSYLNNTLFLPTGGQKVRKEFAFEIPCSWPEGKYDIHVYDNDKWGKMHKIGNFFIVNDNESLPTIELGEDANLIINSSGIYMYTNETVDVPFKSREVYNETIPDMENYTFTTLTITEEIDYIFCNINVTLDKDIEVDSDNDGNAANDTDYSECGGTNQKMWNVSYFDFNNDIYNISRVHKAKITAKDEAGNTAEKDINVTVWVNEEEADAIGIGIYNLFSQLNGLMGYDYDYTIGTSSPNVNAIWDRFDVMSDYIGDEYVTKWNGINASEAYAIHQVTYGPYLDGNSDCSGPEYARAIPSSIARDFNETLYNFLMYINCNSDCSLPLGGPSCTNYTPIYPEMPS